LQVRGKSAAIPRQFRRKIRPSRSTRQRFGPQKKRSGTYAGEEPRTMADTGKFFRAAACRIGRAGLVHTAVWTHARTETAMAITRDDSHPEFKQFFGTAEELIGAGVLRRHQFPGRPGMPKSSATFHRGALVRPGRRPPPDEEFLRVRRMAGGRYIVQRGLSGAEREERRARAEARQALARAEQEAAAALELVPTSATAYRDRCYGELQAHLAFFRRTRLRPDEHAAQRLGGFGFSEEALDAFDDMVGDLLAILRNGGVRFNERRHEGVLLDIRSRVARADAALQKTIAGCITAAAIRAAEYGLRG
jgi:hypothetical protein